MSKEKNAFTLIELLIVISITSILFSFLLPAIGEIMKRARKAVIQTTMTNLESALKMYETDEGTFPPDGIENNDAPSLGGFEGRREGVFEEGRKSRYVDGALVRYLDGDSANDSSSRRRANQYFEFSSEETVEGIDSFHPVFLSAEGQPFFYNELASENRLTKSIDPNQPEHPHHSFVAFRTFQIYNKFEEEENPELWLTNYRN